MLNTISHQQNANQNHKEMSVYTPGICRQKKITTNIGKIVEKLELCCITDRIVKYCRHFGKSLVVCSLVVCRVWQSSSCHVSQ